MRKSSLLALVSSAVVLHALPSRADDGDASIGTAPAGSKLVAPEKAPAQIPPTPASPSAPSEAVVARSLDEDSSHSEDAGERRVLVAIDPPGDWAVLHAGFRPHLGTFGGIGTFALAHARTEKFYGLLSLSAVRNDAGTYVGATQLSVGRNLADTFAGGAQISVTENRARNFTGLTQTALAYNRSLEMIGLFQLSMFNRTKSFTGAVQVGGYNRADKSFTGLAQLGAFNHARGDFSGALQLGVVNGAGPELFDDSRGKKDVRFAGIAQIGVVDSAEVFRGLAQVGVGSFTGNDFAGLLQVGLVGAGARSFRGLAQIAPFTVSDTSYGAQIGAGAVSLEEHTGLQLGLLTNYAEKTSGAQIGLVNVADKASGVQIGVFNHARRLRGLQIGLANHAEDGLLGWSALLNMGFGDGDGGATDDDEHQARAPRPTERF